MKFIKTPVKGMPDMLPADMKLREHILNMIKKTYSSYGFMQIETPVMEHIENLTSNQGGENEKLIFKVMKRGAELARAIEDGKGEYADNGLRYDLTLPLARFYANNKESLPTPFKSMQIGSVWRADNPQKGRFRQFTQCDIDILGDDTDLAEIELIGATSRMLSDIFAGTGLPGFTVHINDRRILAAAAVQAGFEKEMVGSVLIALDKYDKIGLEGIRAELLAAGPYEEAADRYLKIYEGLHEGLDVADFCKGISEEFLPGSVVTDLQEIIDTVSPMLPQGVKIVFDPSLVRGMGYYTGPIFEVTIDGYNFAIAGGGRYDEMIGKFAGTPVAASGFSIGFERIVTILKDHPGSAYSSESGSVAFLIDKKASKASKLEAFAKAAAIRENGGTASVLPMKKNMKRQMELLEANGYTVFEKVYE